MEIMPSKENKDCKLQHVGSYKPPKRFNSKFKISAMSLPARAWTCSSFNERREDHGK